MNVFTSSDDTTIQLAVVVEGYGSPKPEHEGGTLITAKAQGRLSGRRNSEE
jgi:hypothetical protein